MIKRLLSVCLVALFWFVFGGALSAQPQTGTKSDVGFKTRVALQRDFTLNDIIPDDDFVGADGQMLYVSEAVTYEEGTAGENVGCIDGYFAWFRDVKEAGADNVLMCVPGESPMASILVGRSRNEVVTSIRGSRRCQ